MSRSVTTRRSALAAGLAVGLPVQAARAAWPDRPIRWIVGYAPGGGTDTLARLIGAAMAQRLGQPVVIENRPGGATNIAAEAVAKAPPDGHTVFTADNGTLVLNPALFRRIPYDPERDFRALGVFARFHLVLVVSAASPIRTARDYLEAARRSGPGLDYASSGVGSPHHLAMERFGRALDLKLTHVPYRGGAPAMNDLIAGNVQTGLIDYATAAEAVRAGSVRAVAVASGNRFDGLPDLPTFRELGARDYAAYAWQALVAPRATPDERAALLSDELVGAVSLAAVRDRMVAMGVEPLRGTPGEAAAMIAAEREVWVPLIRGLAINLDAP